MNARDRNESSAMHEDDASRARAAGAGCVLCRRCIKANKCSQRDSRGPGEKVTPAHSHTNGEEVIYIMKGSGRVLVAGEVRNVSEGTAVLFPQGAIHMLHNTGSEEMKVVCFFAPATGLDNYRLHEGVDFPD